MNGYLKPIMPVRAFERAADQIVDAVRMGDIRTGDRLPSERDIAATMEISRPSLRAALRVLEDAGIIEVRPGSAGGIFVMSNTVPRSLFGPKLPPSPDEVRSALETRRMFEPRVAHLAAVRASPDDFDRLQWTIDEQKAVLTEGGTGAEERFSCQALHFHMRVAGATHNKLIIALSRTLQGRLESVRELVGNTEGGMHATLELHERTLSAIKLADHEQIERVMEEHIAALELAWETKSARPLVRQMPDFMLPAPPGSSTPTTPRI